MDNAEEINVNYSRYHIDLIIFINQLEMMMLISSV